MKKILDIITEQIQDAFAACGYDMQYGKVSLSNRPDLCEYQCNGALAAAKAYKKAPIAIAGEVVRKLEDNDMLELVEAVTPGFINIKLDRTYLSQYVMGMKIADKFGLETAKNPKKIVIDYGGPNVAKPLHVGHLRSAIIGESIKRINKYMGHEVIGDVHLGDWGLQIGLVIVELKERKPELPYFDESFTGEYPSEPPFTLSEFEEIYPTASARSKEDPAFKEAALEATAKLQQGVRGYRAIWEHILTVSVPDLKKNYDKLNVHFDLWKKESDAQPYIPDMVEMMKQKGYAHESDGALVVDVKEESDTKEMPPCIILKSDGSALYATTDLATIVEREKLFHPNQIIYLADKRQEMHFMQVFRTSRKAKLIDSDTELTFVGFGTMNGKDGKPFKTRDGGVMRLSSLLTDVEEQMYGKIVENKNQSSEEDAKKTAQMVALSAVKYGDLSNQASKDYIFDMERFTSFEGNTGPYILYTIVRIKSILNKYFVSPSPQGSADGVEQVSGTDSQKILPAASESEKSLLLELAKFSATVEAAAEELAPHKICSFIYDLANAFNHFYHETRILTEENKEQQASWIQILMITKDVLETCIDLLGFEAPDRM